MPKEQPRPTTPQAELRGAAPGVPIHGTSVNRCQAALARGPCRRVLARRTLSLDPRCPRADPRHHGATLSAARYSSGALDLQMNPCLGVGYGLRNMADRR